MCAEIDKNAAVDPSPMTLHDRIDLIGVDEKNDRVVLSMIETRPWGTRGENLRDLQEKLNTYLNYVLGGQMVSDYPLTQGKRVAFRLHAAYPLTDKEERYILLAREKFLDAKNFEWETTLL
jgi:hypothetical protein